MANDTGSYFDLDVAGTTSNPYMHTWSLGVEEQFQSEPLTNHVLKELNVNFIKLPINKYSSGGSNTTEIIGGVNTLYIPNKKQSLLEKYFDSIIRNITIFYILRKVLFSRTILITQQLPPIIRIIKKISKIFQEQMQRYYRV